LPLVPGNMQERFQQNAHVCLKRKLGTFDVVECTFDQKKMMLLMVDLIRRLFPVRAYILYSLQVKAEKTFRLKYAREKGRPLTMTS